MHYFRNDALKMLYKDVKVLKEGQAAIRKDIGVVKKDVCAVAQRQKEDRKKLKDLARQASSVDH